MNVRTSRTSCIVQHNVLAVRLPTDTARNTVRHHRRLPPGLRPEECLRSISLIRVACAARPGPVASRTSSSGTHDAPSHQLSHHPSRYALSYPCRDQGYIGILVHLKGRNSPAAAAAARRGTALRTSGIGIVFRANDQIPVDLLSCKELHQNNLYIEPLVLVV